jgi:hypothetical protein
MATPVLDWTSRHDPQSREHGIRELIGPKVKRQKVLWAPGAILNQGEEGACVPHGWVGEALAEPQPVDFANCKLPEGYPCDPQALAFVLYDWCRKHDEFKGDDTSGTSVLQGAKGMKLLGLVGSYKWAFGIDDVIDALIAAGPVVLGIPWFDGMYRAPRGELTVNGKLVGGHCILAIGYDPRHTFADGTVGPAVLLLNSWGPRWGVGGVAWIKVDALSALLRKRGEACIPLRRTLGRPL